MPRILLVGPKIHDVSSLGGAVVSFDALVQYVKVHHADYRIVYLNASQTSRILSYLKTIYQVLSQSTKVDIVMLNFSPAGFKYLGPVLYVLSRLAKKKVVFRMFGGDLANVFNNSNYFLKRILKSTILRSDINYLQTKYLINFFKNEEVENISWLPTSRTKIAGVETDSQYRKRFVFVGQIKEEKGVKIIHDTFAQLGDEYSINYYGPIQDSLLCDDLGLDYCGLLDPEDVRRVIAKYDFLCFPTYWSGEGYPGVIIESYSVGLPVIASRWLSLPELITDGVSGILVNPKDVNDLKNKIEAIDEAAFQTMKLGAKTLFDQFESDTVNKRIIREMNELCVV